MTNIPTFVKWAGGKRQLLEQFKLFFPKKVIVYHDPFVGGGSVAFQIIQKHHPQKTYLSDINEELINCYKVIRNNVEELIWALKRFKEMHSKETYYKIRSQNPAKFDPVTRAARFVYLNKTCFNGLYRVNSKGQFNVPIGSYKNPTIVQEDDLRAISKLLKKVNIISASFENVVEQARKSDFIYFDPPYYPINKQSFTTYTKENFLDEEQKRLAEVFRKLDKKGCLVMLSNSDTPFIKKLYKDYNVHTVKAKRVINCDATKRGLINEIIVTNYPIIDVQKELKTIEPPFV